MEIQSGDHEMMVIAYHHMRSTTEKWIVPGVHLGLHSWPGQHKRLWRWGGASKGNSKGPVAEVAKR